MSEGGQPMIIGVPKETAPGEHRVALVPSSIPDLTKAGLKVLVESGAGIRAGFPDEDYTQRGAEVTQERSEIFRTADVILQILTAGANPQFGSEDLDQYRAGQYLIGTCDPLSHPQPMVKLAEKQVNCFALELVPRITRAQRMDVLSSMATVAGYKAVLIAANTLPRMYPMLMTAAGTITPARVLVVGVGVAGLQAIATARRLGAVVQAYDIRPAVKEQVESLGATFVELPLETEQAEEAGGYAKAMDEEFYRRQRELMKQVVGESDVVITTAAVPGKKAPVLVTADMVSGMKPGSVIIDLAAERGGNCELTRAEETVVKNNVTILGPVNLPATIPYHASQMFSRNISAFLLNLIKDGALQLNLEDQIVNDTLITHKGQVVQPRIRELLELDPLPSTEASGS